MRKACEEHTTPPSDMVAKDMKKISIVVGVTSLAIRNNQCINVYDTTMKPNNIKNKQALMA